MRDSRPGAYLIYATSPTYFPAFLYLEIQNYLLFISKSDRFHIEGGQSAFARYPVCRGKQLTCSNNILNRMGEFNEVQDIITNKTKICLANCEDQVGKQININSHFVNDSSIGYTLQYSLGSCQPMRIPVSCSRSMTYSSPRPTTPTRRHSRNARNSAYSLRNSSSK